MQGIMYVYFCLCESARFARLIFSYWAAPSEGRRLYPREPLHYNHRFSPSLVGAVEVGVKGVLSLWCLLMLLLLGPFAGQRKRGLRAGVLL